MINCSKLFSQEAGGLSHLHFSPPKAPVIVWNLTGECNLSCRHCYSESSEFDLNSKLLSTFDAKRFIDDISTMKVPALLFSGGEPLLRGDIFELGSYASLKGIYTALSTNGTLIKEETAKRIKDAGFHYVGISLDGLKDTHDDFRSVKGSFDLSVKGLDNCLEEGIKTGVRFTLSKYNYNDLDRLVLYLNEKGANRFCLYHLVYSERGKAMPQDDIDNNERREALKSFFYTVEKITERSANMEILTVDNHADGIYLSRILKEKDAKLGLRAEKLLSQGSGCSAGRGIASVDLCGDVHPCQFWGHVSLGNVREKRFSEIWIDKDNEFLNTLRSGRSKLKGRCGRCRYKEGCGGCRLRAEKTYSDMWAEDPACYLTEEEINYTPRV